jgi:hypothetical protein
MKKNFFKKLSFVLALAMMVSVITPAAGAFAATAPKLNSAKQYLYLDAKDGKQVYDFNIANKQKGWKYEWSSNNEDVAEVASNGLTTAVGIGTAKVSVVIYDKDGEEVKELKATVIVKDNIRELTITNTPAGDKLAVDQENDFNRSFVTSSGSTKKTTSITRWSVDKADKATINDSGLFKATEAGKYVITARSFQSTAKYDLWKTDNAKYAGYVTATATYEVTVKVSIKDVKLVTPRQLQVTFDSSVKDKVDGKEDIVINRKLDDTHTALVPVSALDSVSADGKTVTFSVYDRLEDTKTYTVAVADTSFDKYVQLGTPVSIAMENQTIPAGVATEPTYVLLDQYGVNVREIYDSYVAKNSTIPWDSTSPHKLKLADKTVAFVEYSYVIVDTTNASVTTITTGQKSVTGSATTITGTTVEYYVGVNPWDEWWLSTKSVALDNFNATLHARVMQSNGQYTQSNQLVFESLNAAILVVDRFTGKLYPVAPGVALVRVMDTNSNTVGYINVEVTAKSSTTYVELSASSVTLSNGYKPGSGAAAIPESVTVTLKNVDQYGEKTNTVVKESYFATAARGNDTDMVSASVSGNTVTFTAKAGKTGTVVYFVKTSEDRTVTITVTVATPGVVANYAINSNLTEIDSYKDNWTDDTIKFTTFAVDARGVKVEQVISGAALAGQTLEYTITGPTGFTTVHPTEVNGEVSFTADDTSANFPNGTYTFTVKINGISYAKNFTVKNGREALTARVTQVTKTVVSGTAINAAIADVVELKVGSNDVTESTAIQEVIYSSGNAAMLTSNATDTAAVNNFAITGTSGQSVQVFVTKVKMNDGGVIRTVDVNTLFTFTIQ